MPIAATPQERARIAAARRREEERRRYAEELKRQQQLRMLQAISRRGGLTAGRPARPDMPGASLRTSAAQEYEARMAALPVKSWGGVVADVTQAFAAPIVGRSAASWIPGGIPRYTDPLDIGLGVAGLIPFGGSLRVIGRGAELAARAAKPPIRTFTSGGLTVASAAAKSRPGRMIEKGLDIARPVTSKTPFVRSQTAVTGYELGRNLEIQAAARGALSTVIKRAGRTLTLPQQVALHVVGEGRTIDQRIAFHRSQATAAAMSGNKGSAALHDAHISLLEDARKYIDETSGRPVLSKTAPRRLRNTNELIRQAARKREGIYRELGKLTEDALTNRLQAPGRVISGAKWDAETGSFIGGDLSSRSAQDLIRVPYEEGLPGTRLTRPLTYGRGARQLLSGGRRAAISRGFIDPTTTHQFRAKLLESGYFKTDVTGAVAKDLVAANRMKLVKDARDQLRDAAQDIPARTDDVAIRTGDFGKKIPQGVRDIWRAMETGEADIRELGKIDPAVTRRLIDDLFPNFLDGKPAILGGAPGYKWIPRELLEATQLMQIPEATAIAQKGWERISRIGAGAGRATLDAFNALNRASILYLNPAYIPVNFAGNIAMNLMQQGVFAIKNLPRAAFVSHELGRLEGATMDAVMGHGITEAASLFSVTGGVSKVAHAIGVITDVVPRRAAFIHEAGRQGYHTKAQIRKLLLDRANEADLIQVVRRAREAIVDFDRLGPLEKQWATRILFVYPWIKGATRWSMRFPLDHPYQAAAYAYIGYLTHGNKEIPGTDYKLGHPPGPGYTQFLERIPGTNKFIDIRQLFTPSTPIEMGQAIAGYITGDKQTASELIQKLNPLIYNALVSGTGFDPFKGYEVPGGLKAFGKGLYQNLAMTRDIQDVFMTSPSERAERQAKSVRPRTRSEEIAQTFLGGLAPAGFNAKVAAQKVAKPAKTFTKIQLFRQFRRDYVGAIPDEAVPYMEGAYRMLEEQDKAQKALAKEKGMLEGNLTPQMEYAIKLAVVKQLRPEIDVSDLVRNYQRIWQTKDPDTIKDVKETINEMFGYSDIFDRNAIDLYEEIRDSVKQTAKLSYAH